MSARRRCGYVIASRTKVRGKVWWRRPCKRYAVEGSTRCWQHAR